jgi:hypothetical protein
MWECCWGHRKNSHGSTPSSSLSPVTIYRSVCSPLICCSRLPVPFSQMLISTWGWLIMVKRGWKGMPQQAETAGNLEHCCDHQWDCFPWSRHSATAYVRVFSLEERCVKIFDPMMRKEKVESKTFCTIAPLLTHSL